MTRYILKYLTLSGISLFMQSANAEVSFKQDLAPLLKQRCAACHITGAEPGKMALTPKQAFMSLVNAKSESIEMLRVTPYEPQSSYLLYKLKGTHRSVGGKGNRMPFHQGSLPNEDIEYFEQWILHGAKDN